jgi:hypothetical protein
MEDRRYFNISISKKGLEFIQKHNSFCENKIKHILSPFSESEKDTFHQLLDKFIYHCISSEDSMRLVCMQCGAKYEGNCYVGHIKNECFFNLQNYRANDISEQDT